MNIFTIFALIFSFCNLIYTIQVNLGVLHYNATDGFNEAVVSRENRYFERQGDQPRVNFLWESISNSSLISANDTLCKLTPLGLIGVIGPARAPVTPTVESICATLEIPQIQYTWTPIHTPQRMTINFYPESGLLSKGIAALVNAMNWRSFTILYETTEGLTKLKDVLDITVPKESPIVLKHIPPGVDYRQVFKEIKRFTDNTIIIDCELNNLMTILEQAKEVKMLQEYNKYFLTNFDAHTLDYHHLDTLANITTIRLLNTSSIKLINKVKDWNDNSETPITPEEAKVEQAILSDATYFFMKRFYELALVTRGHKTKSLYCNEQDISENGFRLYTYMVAKSDELVSGPIQFDGSGRRIDFQLYAVEVQAGRKEVLADWRPYMLYDKTVNYYKNDTSQLQAAIENIQKMKFIVTSKFVEPYLMEKKAEPGQELTGNDRVEGYAFDLIKEIAKVLNFTFEFMVTSDHPGKFDTKTKTWKGLIGHLLERKAHLAICDLTITETRRSLVDFSLPFMNLGVSIMHRKPKKVEKDSKEKFAFMEPFDLEVWLYTVTLYLIISSVLYVICRFAPGDWENPHPCDPEPEELENIWDLKNCFWLTLGSIMTQGCDILPKGVSSRMGTSMWWFFSLIMTSSYTANLAAFLTKERMGTTISSAEDLSKQTKIKYGTLLGGATMSFFKNSNFSTYSRLWMNMEQAKPTVFEKSNGDGVKRVLTTKNELYAFFMESSSIDYEKEKNCNLKQVGGRLDSKGYGIAMPMNSFYRSAIDQAILKLQEAGILAELKKTWWKKNVKKEVKCDEDSELEGESSNELALDNVGGVFIVLWVGVGIAFLLAFAEFLWNVQQVAVEEHITYVDALVVELKFAVKVWITQKRTKPVLSDSASNASDTRSIAMRVMKTAGSFINLDVFDRISNTQKQ